MRKRVNLTRRNIKLARKAWGRVLGSSLEALTDLTEQYSLAVSLGDLILLDGKWYVTHSGLLRLARRRNCQGIQVQNIRAYSECSKSRWAFKATVYTSAKCRGFVGYGDADPSNVSPLVHGAEMRVAETRAVNRALRKAYGIGICSIEELGSSAALRESTQSKKPVQPANGNHGGSKLRDRLCQLIRQHQLDPNLVKAYAIDFCGTKTLREASRAQIANFVAQLGDWAEKDRNALLCQLNSYLPMKEGAA